MKEQETQQKEQSPAPFFARFLETQAKKEDNKMDWSLTRKYPSDEEDQW